MRCAEHPVRLLSAVGTLVLFKTVFVFDRAQVAPIEGVEQAALEPPCEPLTGDSHRHLIAPLQAFAEVGG